MDKICRRGLRFNMSALDVFSSPCFWFQELFYQMLLLKRCLTVPVHVSDRRVFIPAV